MLKNISIYRNVQQIMLNYLCGYIDIDIDIGKKKTIVERPAPKVIKRSKVIGNIEEIKANTVIKRPKIIGNIDEHKANRVIKIPKEVKVDDIRKRYLNPITLTTC